MNKVRLNEVKSLNNRAFLADDDEITLLLSRASLSSGGLSILLPG